MLPREDLATKLELLEASLVERLQEVEDIRAQIAEIRVFPAALSNVSAVR